MLGFARAEIGALGVQRLVVEPCSLDTEPEAMLRSNRASPATSFRGYG